MNLTQEHINFENSLQQLLGLTLLKVEYLEINYEPENPCSRGFAIRALITSNSSADYKSAPSTCKKIASTNTPTIPQPLAQSAP